MIEDMPRKLPLYVCKQKDRSGDWIFYFRVGKGKRTRLPSRRLSIDAIGLYSLLGGMGILAGVAFTALAITGGI